jgi:lysophospholipase L1-like esterase
MTRIPLLAVALAATVLALPAAASARTPTTYYVSLGDSYAQGVQPIGPGLADIPTNKGYTDFVYKTLKHSHPGLKLVKLGCGGATTDSLINGTKSCGEKLPYKSMSKATSQLTYAAKFMRAHKGQIAFVTLSIGGNDFAHCAGAGDFNAILSCTANGIQTMKGNLPVIAKTIRKAAGPKAKIAANTYPDVVLGAYVTGDTGKTLAGASVSVFKDQVNPALKSAYKQQKINFVDATTAFGAYIPFDQTTNLAPYGTIPKAVANICTFAWYCVDRGTKGPDIHLRPAGYKKLADLYVKEL